MCAFVTPFQEAEAWRGGVQHLSPPPDCEFHKARERLPGSGFPVPSTMAAATAMIASATVSCLYHWSGVTSRTFRPRVITSPRTAD